MDRIHLRMTASQHATIRAHLFPGDGREAVAVALCGRGFGLGTELLLVQRVLLVPHEICRREEALVEWPPTAIEQLLVEAGEKDLAILKIHSHPNGMDSFSSLDDESDRRLFESVFGWTESDRPHASAVMLPSGRVFGRAVHADGSFRSLEAVGIAGSSVRVCRSNDKRGEVAGFMERHAQLFGPGTTSVVQGLRVGVVGCSGTGSSVIEQIVRLGVGEAVLIDPDRVEERNLNRIYGATMADVGRYKVDVLREHVHELGLGTAVTGVPERVETKDSRNAVAACDIAFGCMDSVSGRHVLSRICQYYLVPYIDLGVKLEALEDGTINQVAGAWHYLEPEGRDLMERGVYTMEDLEAEDLYRRNPEEYAERLQRGYVRGVPVDRPAVISVNTTVAGLAVTEMLARLHPFRLDDNDDVAGVMFSLSGLQLSVVAGGVSKGASRRAGRGDVKPPLGMPGLN